MTTVNPTSNSYGQAASQGANKTLGQADFLRLMTEQMRQQDPTKPMDSTQMLSQLAQFSQVQGISDMQSSLNAVALVMENDQALRAANLVHTDAQVSTDTITIPEGGAVTGQVTAKTSGPIQIEILDNDGNRIARRTVEADTAGQVEFEWDGKDDAGNPIAAGTYKIKASAGTGDSANSLDFVVNTRIGTVSFGAAGLQLNTELGPFTLSQLRQIG